MTEKVEERNVSTMCPACTYARLYSRRKSQQSKTIRNESMNSFPQIEHSANKGVKSYNITSSERFRSNSESKLSNPENKSDIQKAMEFAKEKANSHSKENLHLPHRLTSDSKGTPKLSSNKALLKTNSPQNVHFHDHRFSRLDTYQHSFPKSNCKLRASLSVQNRDRSKRSQSTPFVIPWEEIKKIRTAKGLINKRGSIPGIHSSQLIQINSKPCQLHHVHHHHHEIVVSGQQVSFYTENHNCKCNCHSHNYLPIHVHQYSHKIPQKISNSGNRSPTDFHLVPPIITHTAASPTIAHQLKLNIQDVNLIGREKAKELSKNGNGIIQLSEAEDEIENFGDILRNKRRSTSSRSSKQSTNSIFIILKQLAMVTKPYNPVNILSLESIDTSLTQSDIDQPAVKLENIIDKDSLTKNLSESNLITKKDSPRKISSDLHSSPQRHHSLRIVDTLENQTMNSNFLHPLMCLHSSFRIPRKVSQCQSPEVRCLHSIPSSKQITHKATEQPEPDVFSRPSKNNTFRKESSFLNPKVNS